MYGIFINQAHISPTFLYVCRYFFIFFNILSTAGKKKEGGRNCHILDFLLFFVWFKNFPPIMNHFLHLLILLPALFTTIIALPTTSFDDALNSWTDPTLDNADAFLSDSFDGPSTSSELASNVTPASDNPQKLPPVKIQPEGTAPLFICCTSSRAWVDEDEEKQCRIGMEYIQLGARGKSLLTTMCAATREDNDSNCTWGRGEARYCARGITVSFSIVLSKKGMTKKVNGKKKGQKMREFQLVRI